MFQGGEKRGKCLQKIFGFRVHQVVSLCNFSLELEAVGSDGKGVQFQSFGRVQNVSNAIGRNTKIRQFYFGRFS